jgi:acyl carrier protein
MDKKELQLFVNKQVEKFCEENELEFQSTNQPIRLIGSDAILDSMGLVTFLVELEEGLEEEFSIEIDIADEKAMSRYRSPFLNTTTLTEYILERINGKD